MLLPALCALLLLLALASVCLGSVRVPLRDVLSALWGGEVPPRSYNIIRHVRLPRVLAALLVGAALSVSGAVLQAVLMNPLAGPNIIGVNAGSGFFVLGAAVLLPGRWDIIPLAAFAGALLACGIIYGLAVTTGASEGAGGTSPRQSKIIMAAATFAASGRRYKGRWVSDGYP